jgi:hypothetical protein
MNLIKEQIVFGNDDMSSRKIILGQVGCVLVDVDFPWRQVHNTQNIGVYKIKIYNLAKTVVINVLEF